MARPATGKMRPLRFPLNLSRDEREYLVRKTFALKKDGLKINESIMIVDNVFSNGWISELYELRESQKNEEMKTPWLKGKKGNSKRVSKYADRV